MYYIWTYIYRERERERERACFVVAITHQSPRASWISSQPRVSYRDRAESQKTGIDARGGDVLHARHHASYVASRVASCVICGVTCGITRGVSCGVMPLPSEGSDSDNKSKEGKGKGRFGFGLMLGVRVRTVYYIYTGYCVQMRAKGSICLYVGLGLG